MLRLIRKEKHDVAMAQAQQMPRALSRAFAIVGDHRRQIVSRMRIHQRRWQPSLLQQRKQRIAHAAEDQASIHSLIEQNRSPFIRVLAERNEKQVISGTCSTSLMPIMIPS